jgi:hypothetical protein
MHGKVTQRMLAAGALVGLVAWSATVVTAEEPQPISATVSPGLIGLRVNDQPFAVFNHGSGLAKPCWFPLRAPGNLNVMSLAPFDHKHHKGVWIGVEHVNGNNFWGAKYQQQDAVEPAPAKERIANVSAITKTEILHDEPVQVTTIVNDWLGDGGHPVIQETTEVTAFPNRLMIFRIQLTPSPGAGAVEFLDTKEGFLAVRVVHSMNGNAGGTIVNAAGDSGEEQCWGKTSPWVDYSGPVEGKVAGVTLMDHPSNFRPSRYHVRGYGLFAISPFGEHVYSKGASPAAPITLQPDQSLKLTYGLYVHAGDAAGGQVPETYEYFLKMTEPVTRR